MMESNAIPNNAQRAKSFRGCRCLSRKFTTRLPILATRPNLHSSETKIPRARAHSHAHGFKPAKYQIDLQTVFMM
jgi:hypothetical protein